MICMFIKLWIKEVKKIYSLLTTCYSDQPIIDHLGRVVAVMVPPPNDPSYHEATRCAGDRMRREASLEKF